MTHTYYSFLVLILLLISCKSEIKKSSSIISEENLTGTVQIQSPANSNSSLPRLYSNGDVLFLSWVEKKDKISNLKYAYYHEEQWSTPEEIISGSDWFINWADFPVISENNGNILTSYLQTSAGGTYTYDVKLNLYNSGKKNWKKNFILHNDGTKSEHGFVSILPWEEDQFFVTWLDGRNTVGSKNKNDKNKSELAGMTLRGAFVNEDGEIFNDAEIDALTCDCCQTSAAITNDGIIVAYRNRTKDEIRDIAVARLGKDYKWSEPQIVGEDHWNIPGCPVNGPSIDAKGNDVVIAWFTGANENPSVKIAFSEDGGNSFGFPVRVDHGNAIGRVDVAMLDGKNAVICWLEPEGYNTLIQVQKINSDGILSDPVTISNTSAERASGFPQLEILGDKVMVAWTSLEGGASIKVSSLLIENL